MLPILGYMGLPAVQLVTVEDELAELQEERKEIIVGN